MSKPKFRLGDTVSFNNDFSYNPAGNVISIGKIEGINIHRGKGLFDDSNEKGKITYSVSGIGLVMDESQLEDYDEQTTL